MLNQNNIQTTKKSA